MGEVHCLVHRLDVEALVDLAHGFAGVLHRFQGLLVDVGGLDGVDLLLDLGDLRRCLFEAALVDFLAAEGCFRGCIGASVRALLSSAS